jgi:hypothetical protein
MSGDMKFEGTPEEWDALVERSRQRKLLTEVMDADAKDGLYQTWEAIEEEYLKDEYPVFGGPFNNAMSPFEWLKKNYHQPKMKQNMKEEIFKYDYSNTWMLKIRTGRGFLYRLWFLISAPIIWLIKGEIKIK